MTVTDVIYITIAIFGVASGAITLLVAFRRIDPFFALLPGSMGMLSSVLIVLINLSMPICLSILLSCFGSALILFIMILIATARARMYFYSEKRKIQANKA